MYRHWPDSSRSSTPSCWKMSIPFPPKSTSTKAFRGSRCNAFRMDLLFFVFHFQGNKNFLFHKNGHSDSLLKFFFTFYNLLHVQSNGFGANTSLLGVAFLSWDDGILSQRQGWPASPFLWPAEGFPNVKGCGPCKRATEVFFFKIKKKLKGTRTNNKTIFFNFEKKLPRATFGAILWLPLT